MTAEKDVAVLIETSTTWGRSLVRGIATYAQQQGTWSLFVEPRGRKEHISIPEDWNGDGIIARIDRPELAEQIAASGLPAVNVSWYDHDGPNIARVTNDEEKIGELAATHLLDRGLRSFGVLPPHDRPGYRDLLTPSFERTVTASGGTCSVFDLDQHRFKHLRWRDRLEALGAWLEGLPKPAGAIAFSDVHARQLTEACRLRGLTVPTDVAILGCEQDELSSLISTPPISSIHHNGEAVGHQAAEVLERMMDGAPVPATIRLPPAGIISRQSTDILAIEDSQLQEVCAFIRENAHLPLSVEDLLDRVPMSRRGLERRFMKVLGRTPAATVRRIRVERAMRLLFDTDDSLRSIATRCGFGTTGVMTRAFQSEMSLSPGELRRRGPSAAEIGQMNEDPPV